MPVCIPVPYPSSSSGAGASGCLGVLCQGAEAAAWGLTPRSHSPLCKSNPVVVTQSVGRRNVCVLMYWEKLISAVSRPFAGPRFSTEYECSDQMYLKAAFQAACGGS